MGDGVDNGGSREWPKKGWRSRRKCCEIVGISIKHLEQHVLSLVPKKHIDHEGRKIWIYMPGLIKALRKHDVQKAVAGSVDASGDPLLAGSNSPALERYRDEKWKIAKIGRLELEGQVIPREQVHEMLARVANVYRGLLEDLEKEFGRGPADRVHEALSEAEREEEHWFAEQPARIAGASAGAGSSVEVGGPGADVPAVVDASGVTSGAKAKAKKKGKKKSAPRGLKKKGGSKKRPAKKSGKASKSKKGKKSSVKKKGSKRGSRKKAARVKSKPKAKKRAKKAAKRGARSRSAW